MDTSVGFESLDPFDVSLVEQELCSMVESFAPSGASTWSQTVVLDRSARGRRNAKPLDVGPAPVKRGGCFDARFLRGRGADSAAARSTRVSVDDGENAPVDCTSRRRRSLLGRPTVWTRGDRRAKQRNIDRESAEAPQRHRRGRPGRRRPSAREGTPMTPEQHRPGYYYAYQPTVGNDGSRRGLRVTRHK